MSVSPRVFSVTTLIISYQDFSSLFLPSFSETFVGDSMLRIAASCPNIPKHQRYCFLKLSKKKPILSYFIDKRYIYSTVRI